MDIFYKNVRAFADIIIHKKQNVELCEEYRFEISLKINFQTERHGHKNEKVIPLTQKNAVYYGVL